jgi:predicted RNA-binding Zn-ribbon protein involved in translation (DUF1610 family)
MDHEHNLKDFPSIKLNIEIGEKRGVIWLCSIYGCYNHECDIEIPANEIARFYCPQCNKQIIATELCDDCSAPMIPMLLDMGGRVSICSRNGCKKHHVAFEDVADAINKFYREYGYR